MGSNVTDPEKVKITSVKASLNSRQVAKLAEAFALGS